MNKIFLAAIALLTIIGWNINSINAQVQVIPFGDRLPNLHYWDTNWFDLHERNHPNDSIYPYTLMEGYTAGAMFTGRYCQTPQPMKMIGIAGLVEIGWIFRKQPYDTVVSHRVPEYFRLYDINSNLLENIRWDTSEVSYSFDLRLYKVDPIHSGSIIHSRDTFDLYEAYFQQPRIINDDFIIGGTTWNNMYRGYEPGNPELPYENHNVFQNVGTLYHSFLFSEDLVPGIPDFHGAMPPIGAYKYLNSSVSIYGTGFPWYDTTTLHIVNQPYVPLNFVGFFAIFDTLFDPNDTIPLEDSCYIPEGLRVETIDTNGVILAWTHTDSTTWEVEITDTASSDSILLTNLQVNSVLVTDLDTARWFKARVRAVCDSDNVSDWSDSVLFYIPNFYPDTVPNGPDTIPNGPDSLAISDVLSIYTYIMPNPTAGDVTIISSFRLKDIELFSSDGKKIQSFPARGVATKINLSHLAKGIYFVRIRTYSGYVTKRLVKR